MPRVVTASATMLGAILVGSGCYEVLDADIRQTSPWDPAGEDAGRPVIERPELPPIQCDVQPTADCVWAFPRVMIIMDASSSMLGGRSPGENNWDKARFALAGNPDAPHPGDPGYVLPAFERELEVRGNLITMADAFYLGMIAFNSADTQELMLQYAPCASDNIRWAMDPAVSCDPPGCTDPYGVSPVWTYKDSDIHRVPPFAQSTQSYMPPCNPGGPEPCIGAMYNTYTAEGLEAARDNIASYRQRTLGPTLTEETRFANILITDGDTAPDSSPIRVLRELADGGVPTYVIGLQGRGFAGGPESTLRTLNSYAAAGGTDVATLIRASDVDIADAFAATVTRIIDEIGTDPCCQPNDCSVDPEPVNP